MAPRPRGSVASKSTTPARKLATGSTIVMVVNAVGSEPLAKASCTSRPPQTVESTTP